jgi:hypothetical protein
MIYPAGQSMALQAQPLTERDAALLREKLSAAGKGK